MNIDQNHIIVSIVIFSIVIYICYIYLYMGGSSSHKMSGPVVNASAKHTATVIFLHGLGDTGHGWLQGFEGIRQAHIKYLCPNADVMPVSLNFGMKMPSWFDIKGLDPGSDEDEQGIKAASKKLQALIKAEVDSGIDRKRVLIGGFSQGGAVALFSAFAEPNPPLAGIIGLSTWMPLHKQLPGLVKANQETPILQCHGESDPMVNLQFGKLTAQAIQMFNKNHRFKTYPGMGHSSCPQEMLDVKAFIDEHLPPV